MVPLHIWPTWLHTSLPMCTDGSAHHELPFGTAELITPSSDGAGGDTSASDGTGVGSVQYTT